MFNVIGTSRSGHSWVYEVIKSWLPEEEIKLFTNLSKEDLNNIFPVSAVKVVREFDNFLASSIMALAPVKTKEKLEIAMRRRIEAWKAIKDYDCYVSINYDRFVIDREYREAICQVLYGKYTEEKLGYVPSDSKGSSFDQLKYQGEGYKMKVLDRKNQILETEYKDIYLKYLKEYGDISTKCSCG